MATNKLLKQAKVAIANSQYDEALKLSTQALQAASDNVNANLIYGVACFNLGKSDEAQEAYRKAAQLDPSAPAPYKGILELAEKLGNITLKCEAQQNLARITESKGNYARARSLREGLAEGLLQLKEYEKACEAMAPLLDKSHALYIGPSLDEEQDEGKSNAALLRVLTKSAKCYRKLLSSCGEQLELIKQLEACLARILILATPAAADEGSSVVSKGTSTTVAFLPVGEYEDVAREYFDIALRNVERSQEKDVSLHNMETVARKIVASSPSFGPALRFLLERFEDEGSGDAEASHLLQNLIRFQPNDQISIAYRAKNFLHAGKIAESASIVAETAAGGPKQITFPVLSLVLAQLQVEAPGPLRRPAEAICHLDQAESLILKRIVTLGCQPRPSRKMALEIVRTRVKALEQAQLYLEALKVLKTALESRKTSFGLSVEPADEEICRATAEIEIKRENLQAASEACLKFRDALWSRFLQGQICYLRSHYPEAQRLLEETASRLENPAEAEVNLPRRHLVHLLLGQVYWALGGEFRSRKGFCLTQLLKSAKLSPSTARTFAYLGRWYQVVATDPQKAEKCYRKALELDPTDETAGIALTRLLLPPAATHLDAGGHPDISKSMVKKSEGTSPAEEESEKDKLAQSLTSSAAEEVWSVALRREPRTRWALRFRYRHEMRTKRWQEAVTSLHQLLVLAPASARSWAALGQCYHRLGQHQAALRATTRAKELCLAARESHGEPVGNRDDPSFCRSSEGRSSLMLLILQQLAAIAESLGMFDEATESLLEGIGHTSYLPESESTRSMFVLLRQQLAYVLFLQAKTHVFNRQYAEAAENLRKASSLVDQCLLACPGAACLWKLKGDIHSFAVAAAPRGYAREDFSRGVEGAHADVSVPPPPALKSDPSPAPSSEEQEDARMLQLEGEGLLLFLHEGAQAYRKLLSLPNADAADIYHDLGMNVYYQAKLMRALATDDLSALSALCDLEDEDKVSDEHNSPPSAAALGDRLLRQARALFARSVQQKPAVAASWAALGVAAEGDPLLQQHAFIRSLQLESSADSWGNLGMLYLQQAKLGLARSAFLMVPTVNPDHPMMCVGMGLIAEEQARRERSLLKKEGSSSSNAADSGLSDPRHKVLDMLHTAKAAFHIGVDINAHPEALLGLASAHLDTPDDGVSLYCLHLYCARFAHNTWAYYTLGLLLERLGQPGRAVEFLRYAHLHYRSKRGNDMHLQKTRSRKDLPHSNTSARTKRAESCIREESVVCARARCLLKANMADKAVELLSAAAGSAEGLDKIALELVLAKIYLHKGQRQQTREALSTLYKQLNELMSMTASGAAAELHTPLSPSFIEEMCLRWPASLVNTGLQLQMLCGEFYSSVGESEETEQALLWCVRVCETRLGRTQQTNASQTLQGFDVELTAPFEEVELCRSPAFLRSLLIMCAYVSWNNTKKEGTNPTPRFALLDCEGENQGSSLFARSWLLLSRLEPSKSTETVRVRATICKLLGDLRGAELELRNGIMQHTTSPELWRELGWLNIDMVCAGRAAATQASSAVGNLHRDISFAFHCGQLGYSLAADCIRRQNLLTVENVGDKGSSGQAPSLADLALSVVDSLFLKASASVFAAGAFGENDARRLVRTEPTAARHWYVLGCSELLAWSSAGVAPGAPGSEIEHGDEEGRTCRGEGARRLRSAQSAFCMAIELGACRHRGATAPQDQAPEEASKCSQTAHSVSWWTELCTELCVTGFLEQASYRLGLASCAASMARTTGQGDKAQTRRCEGILAAIEGDLQLMQNFIAHAASDGARTGGRNNASARGDLERRAESAREASARLRTRLLDRSDEAGFLAAHQRLLRDFPMSTTVWVEAALAFAHCGRLSSAERLLKATKQLVAPKREDFAKETKLEKKWMQCTVLLAEALIRYNAGSFKSAAASASEAEVSVPTSAVPTYMAALLLKAAKKPSAAQAKLEEAHRRTDFSVLDDVKSIVEEYVR